MAATLIVESLGTTGSGKSALIPILTRLLHNEGWLAMSATDAIHYYMRKTWIGRFFCFLLPASLQGPILWRVFSYLFSNWHKFWFFTKHPHLMCFVLRRQFQRQIPWSHRMMILRYYFQMTGWVQFFSHHAQPNQVIFLDEGFVHRAASLFVSEVETPDPEQVVNYLQLLPPPDLVMWVRVPVDLCLARIYKRGLQARLAHLNTSEARQFLLNAERVCQISAEYAKKEGWAIVEVDNVDGLEECAIRLNQAVMQHLS